MSFLKLRIAGSSIPTAATLVLLAFIATCLISCSPIVYASLWQSKPVKADGLPNEWSKPLRHYDTNTKLQYTFSNDRLNMYLCIRATDEAIQKKILHGGMEIWIDTTGKGKERISLSYPLPDLTTKPEAETTDRNSSSEGDNYRRPKRKFRNEQNEMQLFGFKGALSGTVPLQNMDGIAVNINVDSLDILTYEAIIPFRTFYRDSLTLADSSRVISFKITVNGMPQAKAKNDPGVDPTGNNTPSLSGANMGGTRGGSRGGQHPGQGNSNPIYESHSVKSQIKLSVKPPAPSPGLPHP